MKQFYFNEVLKWAKARHDRRRLRKYALSVLGLVVAVGTYLSLTLPAYTTKLYCNQEEHLHTEDCYKEGLAFLCNSPYFVLHEHEDICYDSSGAILCPLPEQKVHIHEENCWQWETDEDGNLLDQWLICQEEECFPHSHQGDCWGEDGELCCEFPEIEEHWHEESCIQRSLSLICPMAEHTHSQQCRLKPEVPELLQEQDRQPIPEMLTAEESETDLDDSELLPIKLEKPVISTEEADTLLTEEEGLPKSEAITGVTSIRIELHFLDGFGNEIPPLRGEYGFALLEDGDELWEHRKSLKIDADAVEASLNFSELDREKAYYFYPLDDGGDYILLEDVAAFLGEKPFRVSVLPCSYQQAAEVESEALISVYITMDYPVLPATGGMGTAIYRIYGLIWLYLACVFYRFRKEKEG